MDNKIQEQYNEAARLCEKGNFKDAKPILLHIVKEEPNLSDAWRLIRQIDLNVNHDEDKACDELIESLRLDLKNVWALLLMGNLLLKRKDIDTAKEYYSKILEFHPDNAVALNNVATTYAEHDEYDDALIYYEKSLKADPTYQTAYYGKAASCFNKGDFRKCFDTCHDGVFKMKYHSKDKGINAKFFSDCQDMLSWYQSQQAVRPTPCFREAIRRLCVIVFYYIAFARAYPKVLPELGLLYTKAYSMALKMYKNKSGKIRD